MPERAAPHFRHCYVGVTTDIGKRWSDHKALRKCREPSKISKYINEKKFTFDENLRIIFQGSSEECYALEKKLRPNPHMYLNTRQGGVPA